MNIFQYAPHQHDRSVDSTNRRAMEAAVAGAPEGAYFTADEQVAGRGRGNHGWHSPAGYGLYLSVVLRPQLPPNDALWLSLIAALAVHSAVQQLTTLVTDLRWPNDIMLGDKKMGGILTELATSSGRVQHAVIGIGLNVNQPEFPHELRSLATSLRMVSGQDWDIPKLRSALLQCLSDEYGALLATPNAHQDLRQRFEQHSSYARGAEVEIDDHGVAQFSGTTQGLDERGFLLVRTAEGLRTVMSGGVRKAPAR